LGGGGGRFCLRISFARYSFCVMPGHLPSAGRGESCPRRIVRHDSGIAQIALTEAGGAAHQALRGRILPRVAGYFERALIAAFACF